MCIMYVSICIKKSVITSVGAVVLISEWEVPIELWLEACKGCPL